MSLYPLQLVTYENGEISKREYVQVPKHVVEHENYMGPKSGAAIMDWLRENHGYGDNVYARNQAYPKPSGKVLR